MGIVIAVVMALALIAVVFIGKRGGNLSLTAGKRGKYIGGAVLVLILIILLSFFWSSLSSVGDTINWEENDTTIVWVVLAVLVLILILDSLDSFSIRGAIKTGVMLGILACAVWLIWFDDPSAKAQGICPPDNHLEVAQIGEAYTLTAGCTYTFDVKELPRKANGQPEWAYDGVGGEFEKRYIRELVEEDYTGGGRFLKLTPKEAVFEYEKRAPEVAVAFNKLGERSTPSKIAEGEAEAAATASAVVSDLIQ